MTFAEYLQKVAELYRTCGGTVRIGQAYFNCLPDKFVSDHFGAVRDADIDPFHDDRKLPDFLAYVELNWTNEGGE